MVRTLLNLVAPLGTPIPEYILRRLALAAAYSGHSERSTVIRQKPRRVRTSAPRLACAI